MWNCDGPPCLSSCSSDQTYLTQIEYTSRDIPNLLFRRRRRRHAPLRLAANVYPAHETYLDTETATSWDFTSRRCDIAPYTFAEPLILHLMLHHTMPLLHSITCLRLSGLHRPSVKCTLALFRQRDSRVVRFLVWFVDNRLSKFFISSLLSIYLVLENYNSRNR